MRFRGRVSVKLLKTRRIRINYLDHSHGVAGNIHDTADGVTRLGGLGVPVRCDHRNDVDVEALFRRIADEQGRLDMLVNSAWGGYENMIEGGEFTWERAVAIAAVARDAAAGERIQPA